MSDENGLAELDNELLPINVINRASTEAVMAGQTIQQVRGSYATAIACQIPRQLEVVRRRIEDEGRLAGEEFYYGWGAGKERIEGPSVKLANALARCWGNCAIELLPVQETRDAWIFTAVFVDLETGFTLPRQFRQAKNWKVYGKHDDARKDDIRFQIGQSKAVRNVVLNALPASLVERALKAAKSGVKEKLTAYIEKNSLAAAQDLLINELIKLGVKEEHVLQRCRVAERKALDVDSLVLLRGDIYAIRDGQARPEELFPAGDAKDGNGTATDKLAEKLGAGKDAGQQATEQKPAPQDTPAKTEQPDPKPAAPEQSAPKTDEPKESPAPKSPKKSGGKGALRTIEFQMKEYGITAGRLATALIDVGLRGEQETTAVDLTKFSEEDLQRVVDELARPVAGGELFEGGKPDANRDRR